MDEEEHKELVRLIRKIAREEAWQVLDEHIEEYVHKEKAVKESELELHE